MAWNLFGYSIKREDEKLETIVPNTDMTEGGVEVLAGGALGGSYSIGLDMEQNAKTEADLVTKYRSIALQPEIQAAIEEIVNEAINIDPLEKSVEIILDDVDLPDKIKDMITEEFENILNILDFSDEGYDIFQRWYIDGRLHYIVVIDKENPGEGIQELQYIDPRKIQLVKEIDTSKSDKESGTQLRSVKNEYYVYNDSGFSTAKNLNYTAARNYGADTKIAKDSVARVTSGLMDETNKFVLSYLHRAIKPLNQLRILEDATIIYTLTRAPERRVFYIDVGNMPKAKAEQYILDMMHQHKNKLQYNSSTGEISDARKMMTMTEDLWFPRRGGERITEVDQLAGGAQLTDNGNLEYYNKKLQKSLGVPMSRLEPETQFTFGKPTEVSREEVKFAKWVRRLRNRFSGLFDRLLEQQLVLKGIIEPGEWEEIKDNIRYDFMKDNHFEELKEAEIIKERILTLEAVEPHIGVYFSKDWARRNILYMSDDDIEDQNKQIEKEKREEEGEPENEQVNDQDNSDDEQDTEDDNVHKIVISTDQNK